MEAGSCGTESDENSSANLTALSSNGNCNDNGKGSNTLPMSGELGQLLGAEGAATISSSTSSTHSTEALSIPSDIKGKIQ